MQIKSGNAYHPRKLISFELVMACKLSHNPKRLRNAYHCALHIQMASNVANHNDEQVFLSWAINWLWE